MQGQKTLMRAGDRHHAQDPVAPGYHRAQEAVSLGLCHCCKQDKELLLFSARAVPLPSHRTILGVSRLGKMWVFPVCFAGARSLSQQRQPQTLGIALSSWRGTAMGISESGKDGYFEHRAGLTSSRWLLRAGIERGAPRPSLSLPRPWTVGSVSGPSFASSSIPPAHREITAGLTRSKYYADFSLGTLPGVQQEGIMHGVFWLWIKKITEKLTAWWLSQDLEGSGWDMLEKNSLCCLGSFNDFHVPLTSLCAQVLEGKSGETGWIDANSTCVHEDILICQSLLEHWGKICMIFLEEN